MDWREVKTFDDYLKMMKEMPSGPFKPHVYFNEVGKQIEVYWDDEDCYSNDMNGFALHIGQTSGKVVGVTIYSAGRA